MKKVLCLLLSVLMLLLCVGCDTSSEKKPSETTISTTTSSDYKNDPINKWEPWKLPDEIQKDLAEIDGEVIAFKRLGFLRERNNFMLISNAGQIDTIQGNEWLGGSPWTSPYGWGDLLYQHRESMISQLQKIDFETYYLLVCPVKYSSSDFGFEGEPLLQLMKRDNKLYYIIQSDWNGDTMADDIHFNTFFLLVKKSDWTLGEDISSAEVLVYNKNHKDVGGCYYSSKSVFK